MAGRKKKKNALLPSVRCSSDELSAISAACASANVTYAVAVRRLPAMLEIVKLVLRGDTAGALAIADRLVVGE